MGGVLNVRSYEMDSPLRRESKSSHLKNERSTYMIWLEQ